MDKFHIVVDPDLEAIMPRYLKIRWEELSLLEQAVECGDADTARRLGHNLKGTGASYGFDKLTELGAGIELSGKNNDLSTAGRLAADVRHFLENVEVIYG